MIKSEEIMKKEYSKPIADVIEIDEICTTTGASGNVQIALDSEEVDSFQ